MAAIGGAVQERRSETEKETESDVLDCADDSDDDSVDDPSFNPVEETRSALSVISINKHEPRKYKEEDDDDEANSDTEPEIESMVCENPKLDEKDEKTFARVEELIKGGDLENLKVDQLKIYLRKHALRLTGNKATLISRIAEHREIIDGHGEKKYPPESFVFNCKGDACLGDVVIFEQNVYEMFSIASRSATGPSCGTRTVAGRIVKDSYGAAKQQHTFTVEVLWSKGVKPWPPLHPLLIKGRNLYRIKTMRQRWADEGERRKVLEEKHARGFCARSSRDLRLQEKGRRKNGLVNKRKNLTKNSTGDKENHHPQTAAQIQQIGNNKEQCKHQPKAQTQQIGTNKEQHKHQEEMRSTNSSSFASNLQTRDVPVPQQPLPSILGKQKTAEQVISSHQPYMASEYDYRAHVGTSQARNFGYIKHGVSHHHNHHHAEGHGYQRSMESRNPVFVIMPHDHRHNYNNAIHYSHHMHQTSLANQFIHPVQQLYPGFQKKQ